MLELEFYHVVEAESGVRVVKIALRSDCLDIIIFDFGLPDMDGFEAIREIRAGSEQCRYVPILMLSTYGTNLKEAALAAGTDAYFGMPEELERLRLAVRTILAEGDPGI